MPKPSFFALSDDSSDDTLEASKVSALFVSCKIYGDKVFLELNSNQRPNVAILKLPEKQGDHVTSYGVFIVAIVNSTSKLTIQEAPKIIRKIFTAILPDRAHLLEEIKNASENVHDRQHRKKLTALLRGVGENKKALKDEFKKIKGVLPLEFSEIFTTLCDISEESNSFKIDLKKGVLFQSAIEIENLVNVFLTEIQGAEKISFPSIGRKGKNPNEGGITKDTLRALTAINRLYQLIGCFQNEELCKEEKLKYATEFCSNLNQPTDLQYGFNHLNRLRDDKMSAEEARKKTKDSVNKLTEQLKKKDLEQLRATLGALDDELIPFTSTIAKLFFNLFDFHETVEFQHEKITTAEKRTVEDLYDLVARHLVVMFTAFNYILQHLSKKTIEDIENKFFKLVITEQGWEDCKKLGSNLAKQLEKITEEVYKRIKVDDGDYSLLSTSQLNPMLSL